MSESYDELVSRLSSEEDPELSVTRTRHGVTLANDDVRLELVGDEADFRSYVFALSKETNSSFGHRDGMALLLVHIEEGMYSESAVSARWRFTRNAANNSVVEETVLEL